MSTDTYRKVLKQVQRLSRDEQLQLIEDATKLLRSPVDAQPLHNALEQEGMGKETWEGVDIDQYIEQERESWDR